MNQPSLFDVLKPPAPPRVPNYASIRKYLNGQLWLMRTSEVMPWTKPTDDYHAQNFPRYAADLPAEEAADLVAQFNVQWARLEATRR